MAHFGCFKSRRRTELVNRDVSVIARAIVLYNPAKLLVKKISSHPSSLRMN